MMPGMLPNRCFWHVHSSAGVACVFRLGGCGEAFDIVSPSELQDALHRLPRAAVPTVTVDLSEPAPGEAPRAAAFAAAVEVLTTDAEVVLVRIVTPPAPAQASKPAAGSTLRAGSAKRGKGRSRRARGGPDGVQRAVDAAESVHADTQGRRLASAVRSFARRCPEMTDRSKRHKREWCDVGDSTPGESPLGDGCEGPSGRPRGSLCL